ncbi:G5 domain-containing protein, partial [Streptococcus mitis]|uniref:G5 domain-containing protein n=1 Tax=Streptococcus mitis TaxID=28037 RepID=UPI00066D34A9
DKVEVETIPSPVKYEKDVSREKGQDNITVPGKDGSKTTTTTYTVNPDNGEVTPNEVNPVIVNPTETIVKVAAKDKVVETSIEPEVEYVKDVEKDFGTLDQRTEGERGKTVTTTTYDVDPKDGHITEHVGNPVVTPAGKTIVKVGAKTKVERSKDEQGREVIKTTTYEVDPKTGKVAPTTVTTYGTKKEPTVEKKAVPSPVVYEKDDTKEKGTEAITVKGEDGEDTITTTYRVNPTTGEITPIVGKPVRTKEPTNTIVKIPAKDKVVYSKDGDNVVKTVTTYRVEPNTGNITEDISVLISNEHILESAKLDIAALLITKWVDEDGHDLKPADVKEPATLGGANEALEAGEIEEYVFLRTEKDEEKHVVKHIFKKVSSNRLIGINNHETSNHETSNHETSNHETSNHESSNHETSNHETSNHETSNHESSNQESSNRETSNQESSNHESNNPQPVQSDDTERESEKVTLNEQVGEVVSNALTKSNDSQTVLPSTGTESNATLASLGLLGMLSGLGLALGKKKED